MEPSNNTLDLYQQLPDDIWTETLKHITTDDKEVAYVSKKFLALWRAGVVRIRFRLPSRHFDTKTVMGGNFRGYSELRYIEYTDGDFSAAPLTSHHTSITNADTPPHQGSGWKPHLEVGLSLKVGSFESLHASVMQSLLKYPKLAKGITTLSLEKPTVVVLQPGGAGNN